MRTEKLSEANADRTTQWRGRFLTRSISGTVGVCDLIGSLKISKRRTICGLIVFIADACSRTVKASAWLRPWTVPRCGRVRERIVPVD